MYQLGFIGVGNMGGAMARAAGTATALSDVIVANRTPAKAKALAEELHYTVGEAKNVAAEAQYIFLGVKPKDMPGMLASIAPTLAARTDRFVLVSLAAGMDCARVQALAGGAYPVIRLCPNTPVAVGKGLIAWCEKDTEAGDAEKLAELMAGAGTWDPCPEYLMDVAGTIGGCTPAFAYMFIEALSDGAVACGMPRAQALRYAARAVEGAAALAQADGRHPGALKDAVCSPGGSTIQGVLTLERSAFRAAAADAVIDAVEKTKVMGK